MKLTIKNLPLSGAVHVFDKISGKTIFRGTEDSIPIRILQQQPKKIYCYDDVLVIDIEYQRIFYDKEANWFYSENYFKSLFDEYTEQEKKELYHNSLNEFINNALEFEPVLELKTDEDEKEIEN